MKLLYCLECQDIVRLSPEWRSRRCGRSWGHYLEDHKTTIQIRNSLSLAIDGNDFNQAIRALFEQPHSFSPLVFLRAWLNPLCEQDVQYVEPDEKQETTEESSANL